MMESSTGSAHCVALSTLDNFTYPADIFPTSRFYAEDLSDPPLELHRSPSGEPSVHAINELPEPHPDRLRRLTLQQAVIDG